MNSAVITELKNLMQEMSEEAEAFQRQQNLACPSGCGKCCLSPTVEAAPFEMLPLALNLVAENKHEEILARLQDNLPYCALYRPSTLNGENGSCSEYQFRPSVCRLFGVLGMKDKEGETRYSVCSKLKQEKPQAFNQLLQSSPIPPMISEWMGRMISLSPELAVNKMPINLAIQVALEKVLFYQSFQDSSSILEN